MMSMLRHRFSNEQWGVPWTIFLSYSVKLRILFKQQWIVIYLFEQYTAPEMEFQDALFCRYLRGINHVTNRGKASTMLHIVANQGNNNHIMLKQSWYKLFHNKMQA